MVKRSFRAEDLYRLKTVTDPDLSADGCRVAFVVTHADEEADRTSSSIWVALVDGSAPPRRFTDGPGDTSPRWSPDGQTLAYISIPADDPYDAHVRLAPLDGGAPARLGHLPGPVSQFAWSPGSAQLAVVCRTGVPDAAKQSAKERNAPRVVRGLAARFNGVGWRDGRAHIFIVDVDDGSERQLTRGEFDHADPSFSPDGSLVAFVADRKAGHDDRQWRSDVWVVPAAGGAPRRLTKGDGNGASPQFSPDGTLIAFSGTDSDRWDVDSHLFVVQSDGGNRPERVAPETDLGVPMRLPGMAPVHRWTGERALAVLLTEHGGVGLHMAHVGKPRTREIVDGGIEIGFLSARPGHRPVVFAAGWVDHPSELFVVPSAGGDAVQLSHLHDEFLDQVELAPANRATVTRPDGTEVEYFTLLPPGRRPRRHPVHLDIHGGPNGWWPLAAMLHVHQAIAAAGYVVVLPNPRGSAGYGEGFRTACTGDWGGADCDDILACCDDVLERGVGHEDRMFVSGYSYGGFMTSWIAGHTGRFRAATACAAVIDQTSMLFTTDIPHFATFSMGGTPWDRASEYEKRSPLTYLPEVSTPVMVVHWEGDLRVPVSQGEELYVGLRLLGKETEFVRYPGGAHGVAPPSQLVDWVLRILDWDRRHDRRAPPGKPERGARSERPQPTGRPTKAARRARA
jgi:dipeptidyl aminopeptidase/acylaminoacyl peptidase